MTDVTSGTPSNAAPGAPVHHSSGCHSFWDEYRLIQDKIDRIGDFKFRVKSWTAGLATAAVVAGLRLDSGVAGFPLGFILIVAFILIEENQHVWQKALQRRAERLEAILKQRC